MHPGAGEPGERDVAHHHQLLGLRGLAGQAEPGGPLALVHARALGERRRLAVLGQGHPEARRVLERPPHQPVVLHARCRRR